MKKKRVYIYDSTLRDGTQGEGINLSCTDKILIAKKLDELGIDYIEGGWPGSNPKDVEFFERIKDVGLKYSKVAAFGSTRHSKNKPEDDLNLTKLVESETPIITIFGKTWLLHVKEALRVSAETNLKMIDDSIRFLKSFGREVIFDAEHFFDAYKDDPMYALTALTAAANAGADCLALCETNGGCIPQEVCGIMTAVCDKFPDVKIGFHGHNDSACGVANSLMAVSTGAEHIQGTINGIGERCGNADLTGIIPGLVLKMGCKTSVNLKKLTEISKYVDEITNGIHNKRQPYTGQSAFTHKGGIHVSAIQRNEQTYEHIKPETVGNKQRVLVSELSGKSNVLFKTKKLGIKLDAKGKAIKRVLEEVKKKEHLGYEYEAADASLELLIKKALGEFVSSFEVLGFRVIDEDRQGSIISEATVKAQVKGVEEHTAAEGDGPVNALDQALRKALRPFFPVLETISLIDYKVRVLPGDILTGTAAKVRVFVESSDGKNIWGTVGVSTNIIEASYEALIDSIEYKLMKGE